MVGKIMLYHPGERIAYLAPPRTASRSVGLALEGAGFVYCDAGRANRHAIDSGILGKGLRVACGVRSHWDTLVSWWAHLSEGAEFGPWLEDVFLTGKSDAWRWMEPDSMWGRWTRFSTVLVHFELLHGDLNRAVNLPMPALEHIGESCKRNGRRYRSYYTAEHRDMVGEQFADEIARLGYSF